MVVWFGLLASPLTVADSTGDGKQASESWGDSSWESDWEESPRSAFRVSGFVEGLAGTRTRDNPVIASDATVMEARVRLESADYLEQVFLSGKVDGYYDDVLNQWQGDIRELLIALPVGTSVDLRVGRQVLTWGSGDLLFLNDLFAKDWQSFFAGRELEYLKAPANAVKVSYFNPLVNFDFIWTPQFTEDAVLTGERFSYFSPFNGQVVAAPPKLVSVKPDHDIENGEFTFRLYKQSGGLEGAVYGYRGFFKQPNAVEQATGLPTFARLNALGFSVQGALASGIANLEGVWYDSEDDRKGGNPLIPNSQARLLVGYQRELVTHLSGALQAYLEWTQHHDRLISNSLTPEYEADEARVVMTARLTHRALRDNLTTSCFLFWSPTEKDYFVLPSITYRIDDALSYEVGARIFGGEDLHTFFGQHENNSNVYARLRYRF
ncbi:hypothetical protein OLMES_2947 [Oleiphilus messinensis]|uniref:Uncharacterized protein n=1 Tax=Oleiphilus messinensis TaxID=141451 RepID=A0A1Y0I950_9GAMM|nr:hypothetical protein [Oleiphilus messinensis]ARU56991.1 hypothetical protein OLMES_2947 [Oleiphilus messinensis]